MTLSAVSTIKPHNEHKNTKKTVLMSAAGGALGAGLRYIIPTKEEFQAIYNKNSKDCFLSSSKMNARGESRSILKYSGFGALIALGLSFAGRLLTPKTENQKNITYTKYGALLDAPAYSCEIMWYNEDDEK